ncbi:GGDEF domain-containing protein [Devosia lacusdianchii]|uniref:sensor domain-containing diguanylate cyclase n=1 Tax=Devosia lacusdianchii TaxID=2917991 RepID=UPI001F05EC97|nr:GGDEF domain-containing protein [Devosia sp. JXJ CY 41]
MAALAGALNRIWQKRPSLGVVAIVIMVGMIAAIGSEFYYMAQQQSTISRVGEETRAKRVARQALMETNGAVLHALATRTWQVDAAPFVRAMDNALAQPASSFPVEVTLDGVAVQGSVAVNLLVEGWREVVGLIEAGDFEQAQARYEALALLTTLRSVATAFHRELAVIERTYEGLNQGIGRSMTFVLSLQVLAGVVSVLAFLIALRRSNREAKARATAVVASNQTRVQVERLFAMTDMLQSAGDHTDANSVLRATASELLPQFGIALYVFNNSRDRLVLSTDWGDHGIDELPTTVAPSQCWALKRGKPHINEPGDGKLCCEHHSGSAHVLELPMVARGEILGLLQVYAVGEDGIERLNEIWTLATALGDAMSLALSNIMLREKLSNQALRDALTGLYNRRYMEDTLLRFSRLAERENKPLSAIMIDLDHFKRLNDEHGHAMGDAVLRDVASTLIGCLRESDVACRYGGEELIVLLPSCDIEDAAEKAEVIRSRIAALSQTHNVPVSASLGVATIPVTSASPAELVAAADAALYRAKQAGRNQVMLAPRRGARTGKTRQVDAAAEIVKLDAAE